MSEKNKIKHTHFGENTGSYYGIGKQTEETVTPSGTIEQPIVPPPAPIQQEQKTTDGEAVVPQDKSIEALQGILKSKVTKPVNDEDTGLGIDYSSYKLRQWNKDKNKKVKQFVTDNAMALPEVAKIMSAPEMQAKVENDKRIQEAFQKLQPSNVQSVQQNEDQLKSGQLYKNSVIQANQNGIPEAYGYSEKIPMAVQKSIIGKVIPSLAPDEEKQQYVKDNGLEKIQPNANVKLYSDIQKGITSNNFLVGIDDRTKEFQNNQLDVSSLDKTTKLAKVGEDIDKLYSQVITKQRDELKLKDPDLKAFNDSQVNYTQIVNNIKELQKDDSVKQLELLLPKHGELMKAYKEKTLAIQPKLTEVLKQRDEYLSGLTKDEKGQYIVNPDEALIKVKDEATQYYNSLIEESKKNKEGEIKVSDADLVLARQKVLLAQDEIALNIKQKETEFDTITKANIDNVKGQDVLQIEKDITELEQQDIVKAYFDKTNPVINNYTDNVKLLDDAQLNLDATKLKAEEALRKYQSTDKNEIKYAKSIEDLKKTLIELNKKEKTAWLPQLANKYGVSLTPEIIQNEYIKATNAFRYNDIAKAGFVPMVSVKEDDKIKEVLYSQEYQFASTLDKKIMLNEYYSEVKPQGLTRQNFFTKYQKYIYEPLDVILLKTNAEELKLRSSIERKTHPELYRGTYADAIQGKDIIGGIYFKSENQIDADLSDKIIDRITSLPSEKLLKDFWKGLFASEAKDWMPVLGGLVDYVEQKRIYEAYRAVANNIDTFEQARLVRTIDSFKTIQSKFGQDTFTSYNVGNKYFPQMMKFIGEISAMSGTSKLIEAGLSEFEIVQMIGKQFNKATSILGASEETQVILSKLATRPAGILLRAFASSQTVGIGSTLASTYEKLTPFVLSKVDPETLKITDYKLQEQQFTSFAKAYLKSSIQQSIEYGTEELGFLVDKPIKYIVGKRLGDIALRVEKFSLKSKAVRSFMDMLSNPETGEILLKGALYTKLKELAPYLTMKGGALTYGQVHSIPAEAFEEVLADLLNNHLDDAFENKRSTDMDTDGYVKGKFKETVGIMLPLTAMSTLLGVGNIALKSFHIAKTESYKADELDIQFLNLDQAQAASFAFPFGRHKRKNLKAYMSLVSDIIEETEMNDEKVTKLTEQIDFLEKNREIKLARLATALLEKRLNFEDEKVTDTQSFKEYYEQFKEESTKLKSFIQGTLAEGAIDHTAFQSLKSQVSDKRILDEIEHLEIAYAEFENQKSNKLIPDNYTFKNFYQKENAELEKIQSTLYNYIAGGGSINFNEIKQAISTISLSTQKYNELTNLVQEAQEIFVRNQNVIVDDIIFSPEGTKRRFTDLSKEESDKRITLAQNKANTGMFANTGTSIRITKDITDKDGNNFDIKVNPQGEVHFVDDFNYDKFKKFILEELGHLPEMARKAYFYTLAQNKSLTFEQKANLLQMINNKLAEDLSEQKIVLNEGLKQMALLNQALKDLGITYAADIQGERPTNGVIAYAFMKGNFNYDKDSAKFFLTNEEYRLAKGFLNAMKNYSQLISNDKISNLENRLVTDRSYTLTDPNEDDVDTVLDALQQNDTTSAIVGKNLKKKDVIKYLSELKENKQISRSQLTAIAQVIMNTARNFKRMGIIKSESEFLDMLPQMKQLQVNMTDSNKKLQNPAILLQQELDAQKINKEAGVDVYVARQGVETNGEKYTLSQIKENGNTNTFVIEDANGSEIGKAQLSADGNYLENIRIDEKHRRKGLASKVYDFIELRKGIELQPSPNKQSKEAKALWDNRNLKKSVSDKAKANFKRGIALFQQEDKIKGIFNPIENIIIVLKTGDISTVMHELAHSFKFLLQEAADNGNVKAQEKLKVFQDFANSEEGKRWYKENIQQEGEVTKDTYKFENELFARAFERYLRDGSYSGIQDGNFKLLLNEFKEWLKGIYEDIKSGVLNIKLTKEMRNMFEDISGNRIDIDKDLMSYIESKFGRFSERKNITKEMLSDLLKEAEKGIDPEIYQKAMESLHKIFALYKKQYIGQRYKGNSKLINPQLRSLLNTPRHNVIEMYRKDIKNFEEIIDNSRYRFTYQQMINQRKTTVQRFISNRKENLDFWTEMKKLATIEHRSIDSQASMENYIKLLRAKPEDFGVDQLKKMTEKYINDSEDYKISKLNSNKEESEEKDIHVISQHGLDETRQNKIRAVKESRDYAVNIGNVKMQKGGLQSQFFSLDPNDMTDSELDEYNSLLTEAIRSEGNFIFSNNFVDFTIKNKARLADELMQNELSSHWIDKMSDLNNRMFRNVPFVRQAVSRLINPFGYGLAENYNMKDYLNFFDGIQNDYSGNMVKTIFQPLEDAHDKQRAILKDLFTKMNEFRANKDKTKNLTEGDFHTIGIYWLLSQKPDIKITEDYFNVETDPETGENTSLLERLGFDQEDVTGLLGMTLRADEFHEKDNNGVWKEKQGIDKDRYKLYQAILNNRMQYLRDSVMISFGEKPEWMDEKDFKSHLKKQLNDPYFLLQAEIDLHTGESNMLKQIFSQLQQKKLELLKNTGAKTVAEVVDNIINKQLAGRQDEFISLAISAFDKLQEGEHTDGVTMKDMAQNYTNKSEREFVAIKNYAPIIRNVTSSIEGIKPLENEAGAISEADGKWGIRTGINISNQFTKTRNQNISTLETNAFKMIEKRFDQELFYMMNEPHRLFLKELLNKTDGAFASIDKKVDRDGNVVSSEDDHKSSDYIKNMITLYYRRNMTPAKLDLKNSKVTGGIHELLQTYRVATLAPMRSSFGQITSTFMSQENMFGGYADRFQDMASGFADVFSDNDIINKFLDKFGYEVDNRKNKGSFLEQHGAEVLNRGLTDYDLGQGKENLNFGNITKRYFKGEFDSEDGDIKSFWKSMKDKGIPTEKALMPLVFFDRTAARATFFGAYRNYCRHYGIKVDFVNPDEDAINFANSTVRKTQNTDNELYKTGVLAGVSTENNGRDTFLPVGKGTAAYELLRQGYWNFKSFAIAEQNNIAIKFIKAFHAENNYSNKNGVISKFQSLTSNVFSEEMADAVSAIGYNFVGKMLYNYVKSASKALFTGTGLYIAYLANMGHLGDGDDENIIKELITGEFSKAKEKSNNAKDKAIANAKQVWQNEISGTSIVERDAYKEGLIYNATKSILDEFQVNEFSGQISSLLMKSLHESTLDDNQEVGDRMNKLYKQADEIDMMSLITKVFGVSLTGAVFGDKVERNSEISHLQDVITSIKNKDTENIGYNDMTSVWLFLSQIAGFNLFGRLPLSYPSIRKWTEDIDKYNRQQTDMLNTKIQDKKEKEEDEIPVENYSPDEEN